MAKKITWLRYARRALSTPPGTMAGDLDGKNGEPPKKRLTISLLTFSTFESCAALLEGICDQLLPRIREMQLTATIVVRNNNPALDSTSFDEGWTKLRQTHTDAKFMLFNDGYNVGFGRGHNANFEVAPSDLFLVLNDDLGFPTFDWFDHAVAILQNNDKIAILGASQSPGSVTSLFGNGVFTEPGKHWPLRYVEASILLTRSQVFDAIGKFDDAYEWAMCEDADLSFRAQAHGYKLAWTDIPHEHWRSTSFNVLPSQTKNSILEHNRSVMFSKWNVALSNNDIGRYELLDIWSDGIGDVFCAMLHLKVFVTGLTDTQKKLLVLNTSAPDLARAIFGNDITIDSVANEDELQSKYTGAGIHSYKSTRRINYGLPFNIHALVCTSLGIPVASQAQLTSLIEASFANQATLPSALGSIKSFCVLHLESERTGHDGRGPSALTVRQIASSAADHFSHLVLVGKQKIIASESFDNKKAVIVDLQGQLSLTGLVQVIAQADAFVGIDSFPAHVAQVAGVRSAVFFGSVHPSFRVLSEGQTWPIVKPIDCIGCYHAALEPSVPFCMRRDLLCTKEIPREVVDTAIGGCAKLEAFDWRVLTVQALELQRKFFTKLLFHPAPPRHFFDGNAVPNGQASGMVYQIMDEMRRVVSQGISHAAIDRVQAQLEEEKRESFRKDLQIESMLKLIGQLRR